MAKVGEELVAEVHARVSQPLRVRVSDVRAEGDDPPSDDREAATKRSVAEPAPDALLDEEPRAPNRPSREVHSDS